MVKYFINGTEIKLKPETIIALTFQYYNIVSMTETQTSFTNTFVIPNTNANLEFLENINLIISDSDLPYDFLDSNIEINGFGIYGKSIIESYNSDGFSITFYGEIINAFDLVNDINLNEIDFSEYNHTWDFNTVVNSRENEEGYIYPLIDWSDDKRGFTGLNQINPRYLFPLLFVSTIFEKLFEKIGYNYSGDLFDNDYFKNALVSLQTKITDEIIYNIENTKAFAERVRVFSEDDTTSIYRATVLNFIQEVYDPYNSIFKELSPTPFLNALDGLGIDTDSRFFTTYKAISSGTYTFETKIKWVRPTYPGAVYKIKAELRKSDGTLIDEIEKQDVNDVDLYPSRIFTLTLNSEVVLSATDKFYVVFYAYNRGAANPNIERYYYRSSLAETYLRCTNFIPSTDYIEYTEEVYINANLPEITAGDLLQSIKYLFGQIITVDAFSKTIYFNSLDEIKSNTPKDWSDKFDSLVGIEFHPELSKNNYFKYNNESYIDSNFGSGILKISDETLQTKQTIVELPFSASTNTRLVDTRIARVNVFELVGVDIERVNDFKDRILLLNKLSGYTNITYDDDVESPVVTNENIPYAYFSNKTDSDFTITIADADKLKNGLDFQNVIETKYTIYDNIFDKYKSLNVLLKLSESDIVNFDFKTPIYLKQFGNKFYVNSIQEFTGSKELTQVELIKI